MRIVVALGENALLRSGQPEDAQAQRTNAGIAASAVAALVTVGHDVVVTHGNGPQVGLLALQAAGCADVPPCPLDILDAESEGMIGYVLDQELGNRLPRRQIATLLTQVVVDPADPAFSRPTKPIGPRYRPADAARVAEQRGWVMKAEGDEMRRVVPSPLPLRIVELETIRLMIRHNVIVVCMGGGGIPVVQRVDGSLIGVQAVIDKDRAAAFLAEKVDADLLLMLTDVDAVHEGWGTPFSAAISHGGVPAFRARDFEEGTMGPKVAAGCDFVAATGRPAAIGRFVDAVEIVAGRAGSTILPKGRDCASGDLHLWPRTGHRST